MEINENMLIIIINVKRLNLSVKGLDGKIIF